MGQHVEERFPEKFLVSEPEKTRKKEEQGKTTDAIEKANVSFKDELDINLHGRSSIGNSQPRSVDQDGENIKYFYSIANKEDLEDNGEALRLKASVQEVLSSHLSSITGSSHQHLLSLSKDLYSPLNLDMFAWFTSPFFEPEVVQAIWTLKSNKSPRLDGFMAELLLAAWENVK